MSSLSQDSPSAAAPDILVTGASGFIGGHLVHRLAERGHRVRVQIGRAHV